ncbi:laminin subunit gamma-3 [Osmerus eperlanus]|uniref:laminin subunit gamma-3 n=1 Tax=Osmerus eperlanus TaxID=29151 RepID=UPI002E0D87A3
MSVVMEAHLPLRILAPLVILLQSLVLVQGAMSACYDDQGTPEHCLPRFENVAFNRTVFASNTCGDLPEDYCMQSGSKQLCNSCDASMPERSHNASLLTDFHSVEDPTWWQSQSMFYGIQHPSSVNLTLHLGKSFEISYVRLQFYTSRPESFAIYKRTSEGAPWQAYQYYSASCKKTYGREGKIFIRPGDDERMAVCVDEFSDISPLTGGNVAFSTLEGRPSAYNFDQSAVLQEWVTATDLLISLDRLNTFGDEFFKDIKVLQSYSYAISDFSVGGRCKCNGHASECVQGTEGSLVCSCQHHTAGVDCQECAAFYQDRPWARATADSANECRRCNCSGRADACVFDAEQYRSTGSGGRCVGCRDDTDGAHCERCREHHHRRTPQEACSACDCDPLGSVSLQCNAEGRCVCRAGVMGERCDACQPGYHSLGPGGCRPCACDPRGSIGVCAMEDGQCRCRAGVEGHACDRCKPGFFNLQQDLPSGCQPCFCFGHSVACTSSSDHVAVNITSDFVEDQDGWSGEFSQGQEYPLLWKEGEVYLLPLAEDDLGYYRAPEKFLGAQLLSYGRLLSLIFTAETPDLLPASVTVLLEGPGDSVSASLSSPWPLPTPEPRPGLQSRRTFTVRLHEEDRRLQPSLSPSAFRQLLFNLTALRITNAGGPNYTSQLSEVTLASAAPSFSLAAPPAPAAPWVEDCYCPLGFQGQFCERCGPGFTREVPSGGALSPCVPCDCHMHGPCHPDTGVCECSDFTTGPTCQRCLDGYYGNALIGMPNDCRPCPCPDRTSCAQMTETGDVVCTNCPPGRRGTRCEMCEDGFYGDPLGRSGPVRPCERCNCHGNVDLNALGVCDHVTGLCLKCLGHTEGDRCQRCQRGFYGDALSRGPTDQKCKPCSCSPAGTSGPLEDCHPQTGSCQCLSHVTGRDCGHCKVGFFNLQPGIGCERCNCNPIGSSSVACHPVTSQCMCRAGVEGVSCGSCRIGFFGFSSRGCRACNCDPMGSTSMQCHGNGTCPCRQGFVGYKCDQCELDYFHNRNTHQCEECPVCYGLVKEQARKLRTRLQEAEKLLSRYNCRGNYGRQLQPRDSEHHQHEHQGEDSLPNALEDFLALQEAKEVFIKQFTQLGASAHTLSVQLHGAGSALDCRMSGDGKEEGDQDTGRRSVCRTLASSLSKVEAAHTQLQKATLDLWSMMVPFELPMGPNRWNAAVNDSRFLMTRQVGHAGHIEAIAGEALAVSNHTLSVLVELLEDNSTEEYIRNLTEQLADMRQRKHNLTAQVNETLANQLALEADSAKIVVSLGNLTSSLQQLGQMNHTHLLGLNQSDPGFRSGSNQSDPSIKPGFTHSESPDLQARMSDLALQVNTKEELVSKIREEMEPKIHSAQGIMEKVQEIYELQARTQGSKAMALSSVVTGKEVESDIITLHRELEDIQREWPARQTQTRAAQRKERLLGEKLLPDVRRKMGLAQEVLTTALENATLSNATARQAEPTAHTLAKKAKATLSQAKQTRSRSAQLSSSVHAILEQLAEQEYRTASVKDQINSQSQVSLTSVKESMETAKRQLEAYSLTLTELVSKIDGTVATDRFDRILNETTLRLSMLRGSVESPVLNGKIQKLTSAARDQQKRLSVLEQDLQEIREERDSLSDIALQLPKSCP